ncbi:histidine phosphatase family protein [Heyndrickxia oleronia]|uniref:histidine phosphatase family protein n=1 Tax=Heyndrickxia oleronia TaxID=38875 RepID=UPI001C0F0572|nr:histidine phosphatase family protein [Heyndrickxia oleronia]MBU5210762.1 histidine phosphatase family protein [Heyndrickxia oleronia]
MTTIGLIRHGITDWNELGKAQGISDISINDIGKIQAKKLGQRLSQDEDWDMLITSNLLRAIETASIIGNIIDQPISSIDDRIREINCGMIEGTTEEERINKWGRNWRNLELGIENFENVAIRGLDFLEDIVRLYKNKRVLAVSHGTLIGLTLQRLLPEEFRTTYIENTSLTILRKIEDRWQCQLYNCTIHLK